MFHDGMSFYHILLPCHIIVDSHGCCTNREDLLSVNSSNHPKHAFSSQEQESTFQVCHCSSCG